MTDYQMPVLTEREREGLLGFLTFLRAGSSGQHQVIYQIALAALTAKPEFFVPEASVNRIRNGEHSACCNIHSRTFKQYSMGFYSLPPVPVIKQEEHGGME